MTPANAKMIDKLSALIVSLRKDLYRINNYVVTNPASYEAEKNLYDRGVCEGKISLATDMLRALATS